MIRKCNFIETHHVGSPRLLNKLTLLVTVADDDIVLIHRLCGKVLNVESIQLDVDFTTSVVGLRWPGWEGDTTHLSTTVSIRMQMSCNNAGLICGLISCFRENTYSVHHGSSESPNIDVLVHDTSVLASGEGNSLALIRCIGASAGSRSSWVTVAIEC